MSVRSLPFLTALVLVLGCAQAGCAAEVGPPNVLLIVADDHSHDVLAAAGHPFVRTPNLDRLAREGVRFQNAFCTTSLCSPARVSLLTGLYARKHRILNNFEELGDDAATLGTWLGRAGWDTGYFGKWHVGNRAAARPGFATAATYAGQGRYFDCEFWIDGRIRPSEGFVDDVTTDHALAFLRAERDRPFFACIGFKGTHGPRQPPPRSRELYLDESLPWPANVHALPPFPTKDEHEKLARAAGVDPTRVHVADAWAPTVRHLIDTSEPYLDGDRVAYHQLVTAVDDNVGRLLDALDELDLADDTLVVYCSDNGYSHGSHGLRGKRSAYEESMRIPLLMRYPNGLPAGREVEGLVLNVDVVPTVLRACGLDVPERSDGRDVAPLAIHELYEWRDAFVYEYYWESPIKPNMPTVLSLRTRSHKLVTYPEHPGWTELFDLRSDPGERRNLFDDPDSTGVLRELQGRLAALDRELGPRPRRVR